MTKNAETVVRDSIQSVLTRRGATGLEITPDATLHPDLNFDSLELAELSADLEDRLGRDPYSEGIIPRTVGELIAYYNGNHG